MLKQTALCTLVHKSIHESISNQWWSERLELTTVSYQLTMAFQWTCSKHGADILDITVTLPPGRASNQSHHIISIPNVSVNRGFRKKQTTSSAVQSLFCFNGPRFMWQLTLSLRTVCSAPRIDIVRAHYRLKKKSKIHFCFHPVTSKHNVNIHLFIYTPLYQTYKISFSFILNLILSDIAS